MIRVFIIYFPRQQLQIQLLKERSVDSCST
jgi:hypothetical protein